MKNKKVFKVMLIIVICVAAISSHVLFYELHGRIEKQLWYNKITSLDNYHSYTVTLEEVGYADQSGFATDEYTQDTKWSSFDIRFNSLKDISTFTDTPEEELSVHALLWKKFLEIGPANTKELYNNGFFEVVEPNTEITITFSNALRRGDDQFNDRIAHVIAITYNGVEYLNEEIGLKNLADQYEKYRLF